ncbi:MAG: GDP-mannose 4,6-dehydratase [Candidatus Omnitrophica bacterium]|nr:GDP-mannose 4,6-dehydratase [Candidatus Omnitrophota bacterium]MDD5352460.1 GDP-mannose 4,6-dehydratase [Candidatus Omnitrophota bacterium]MDD5550058.1 GDP-mannose 4,6-dehydratase [Candidatus Omnitrophota bacterium]
MKVVITGIAGFVGSHLAEFLLDKNNVNVFGIDRWLSRLDNIQHIKDKIKLIECDLTDPFSTNSVIEKIRPDLIFHLAAQSFVPTSWSAPHDTLTTNIIGELNIFEAVRKLRLKTKIQIACSSEEYGMVYKNEVPIKETNPLRPLSPYGVSKVAQDLLGYQYYQSYNMFIVRTRGFNHTGPRRGENFVTSNFAKQIALIEKGSQKPVMEVGNLNAIRDFTDVRDMVKGYWLALEKGKPGEEYNICSGKGIIIKEALKILLKLTNEKISIKKDPRRLRPSDVEILIGDCSKFRKQTGWKPEIPLERTLQDLLDYWRERV